MSMPRGAAVGHSCCHQTRSPSDAASQIQDAAIGFQIHLVNDDIGDGAMTFGHTLAAAGGRPLIELVAELFFVIHYGFNL
jgi:hypothetical protein